MNARALCGQWVVIGLLLGVMGHLLSLHLNNASWYLVTALPTRIWSAASAILAYSLGCLVLWWRNRLVSENSDTGGKPSILLAWASQGGFAEHIAQRSAQSLNESGCHTRLQRLDQLNTKQLSYAQRILFVVSTTGEGDAPDHAIAFLRQVMPQLLPLPQLHYAILALGDRHYAQFCAFGCQLDHWLSQRGAHALFDMVKVDKSDPAALRHWQQLLGRLGTQPNEQPDWSVPEYSPWRLHAREHLNPGSVGAAVFHLQLHPEQGSMPHWQAGDIAEIGPQHSVMAVHQWMRQHGFAANTTLADGRLLQDVLAHSHWPERPSHDLNTLLQSLTPLPHREYSIASLPNEGALHLLVRRHGHSNGHFGLGSGWLCEYATIGAPIAVRLRSNRNFHPPPTNAPLILIGNGTGIAGLRAHLRARIDSGLSSARRNWLLFGERNQHCDFHFGEEIQQWQHEGWIERLDTVFSRDNHIHRYVQDALATQTELLRHWMNDGAVILVCGSLQGMAPAIDAIITQTFGNDYKEQLIIQHRYRRDVY